MSMTWTEAIWRPRPRRLIGVMLRVSLLIVVAIPTRSQRADDNAVAEAQDAFGPAIPAD